MFFPRSLAQEDVCHRLLRLLHPSTCPLPVHWYLHISASRTRARPQAWNRSASGQANASLASVRVALGNEDRRDVGRAQSWPLHRRRPRPKSPAFCFGLGKSPSIGRPTTRPTIRDTTKPRAAARLARLAWPLPWAVLLHAFGVRCAASDLRVSARALIICERPQRCVDTNAPGEGRVRGGENGKLFFPRS